jgi:two-component system chemotaxis sensor kinase CheA
MDELTREFLIESQEGLDRMERCLTGLERSPGDAALIAEIFRSVHTIKGTTGFLGYKRLEKLAHAGENLLGLLREGKIPANAVVVTTFLELIDALRFILRSIEADESEGAGDDAELIERLDQLQAKPADELASAAPVPAPQRRKGRRRTAAAPTKPAKIPPAAPAAVVSPPAVSPALPPDEGAF